MRDYQDRCEKEKWRICGRCGINRSMSNFEEVPKHRDAEDEQSTNAEEKPMRTSIEDQVRLEFEYAADYGQTLEEQIENELAEADYILPSPMHSLNDTKYKNITADQKGRAFGIANQRNEPPNSLEEIEKRDEDRWSLNPESAENDIERPDGE